MTDYTKYDPPRPIISGVIWFGIGLYLLGMQHDAIPPIDESWPAILVIIGFGIVCGAFRRKRRKEAPPDLHQQ